MSALTKKEIAKMIEEKKIEFEPEPDQFQIQPNSIDLRVGWNFYVPKSWEYNEKGRVALNVDHLEYEGKKELYKIVRLKGGQYFEILPGEFVIVSTLEKIKLNAGNIMAALFARSSFVRRGLNVGSGTVDARYQGFLMLPITNNTRDQVIRIYPGERICQLVFFKLSSSLTEDESLVHGVAKAKYIASTPYGLEPRSDSREEIDFIKKGEIEKLKEKYGLKN